MKTATIPPLRVSPELRRQAEAVLEQGETLSGFVLDAVTRSIGSPQVSTRIHCASLSSAAQAKKTGKYLLANG